MTPISIMFYNKILYLYHNLFLTFLKIYFNSSFSIFVLVSKGTNCLISWAFLAILSLKSILFCLKTFVSSVNLSFSCNNFCFPSWLPLSRHETCLWIRHSNQIRFSTTTFLFQTFYSNYWGILPSDTSVLSSVPFQALSNSYLMFLYQIIILYQIFCPWELTSFPA